VRARSFFEDMANSDDLFPFEHVVGPPFEGSM
jgi:hypothetical protein